MLEVEERENAIYNHAETLQKITISILKSVPSDPSFRKDILSLSLVKTARPHIHTFLQIKSYW